MCAKDDLFVSEFNFKILLLNLRHSYYCLITFKYGSALAYITSPILWSESSNKSGHTSSFYSSWYNLSDSNVQEFVAELFCSYLLIIMRPHSSELLMKYSVSTWADLFSFSPNGRLLLNYGMWRRLLDSSQKNGFIDCLPFISFSTLSCNPRSRSVRFHFSPWKCSAFERWWYSVKIV